MKAPKFNATEAALDPLEKSWADFLYGTRIIRRIRAESRQAVRMETLPAVHRVLNHNREQLARGDRTAILTALVCCIEENVPLPYWLGDAILDINTRLHTQESNLHALFGLESKLPTEGKKATTARRDLQLQADLWFHVTKLIALSKVNSDSKPLSKNKAITQAIAELRFPYSLRQSTYMFDAQDRLQSEHLDAMKGKKTVKS